MLRPPLIDIQQTVAFCPHYQQGCCHWVMLPGTQASYASVSTAARLQLLLSARLQLHIHSFLNICMCHSHFCSLYQIIQSSALSGLSLASPFAGEQLCFPHPAVTSKDSQSVSRRSSNSILPLDEAMARILYFLSHGKGSKHKPQMAELGRALEKSNSVQSWRARRSKRQREGKKKWIWLEMCEETEQRQAVCFHNPALTHWNTSIRIRRESLLLCRS